MIECASRMDENGRNPKDGMDNLSLLDVMDRNVDSMQTMRKDLVSSVNSEESATESGPFLELSLLSADNSSLCPYCGKQFRKPRVLDCLHSMCEDCIIAQLDGRSNENKSAIPLISTDFELENTCEMRPTPPGVIRCPICQQESHVGNDVRFVNHLLLDFVRMHEVETITTAREPRCCQACKSGQMAMAVCKRCVNDLCANCYQAHCEMKLFEEHTVVTYSELERNPAQLSHGPVMCVLHPQLPYTLLCCTCESLICIQCQTEHSDANIHSLIRVTDQVVELIKQELLNIAKQAQDKAKSADDACNCVPERQGRLSTQYESIKVTIDEAFQGYHKALEMVKQKLIKNLDRIRDDQEVEMENLNQRICRTTQKISDAVAFTNRIVEKGSAMEVVMSRKKILQQLTSMSRSMPDMSSSIELEFIPTNCSDFVDKAETIIGDITTKLISDATKNEVLISALLAENNSMKQLTTNHALPVNSAHSSAPDSLCNTPAPILQSRNPGAIGMERRNKTSGSSSGEHLDMWSSCTTPVELVRTLSNGKCKALADNQSNFYEWPPSSDPIIDPPTPVTAPTPTTLPPGLIVAKQASATNNNSSFMMPRNANPWMLQSAVANAITPLNASAFSLSASCHSPFDANFFRPPFPQLDHPNPLMNLKPTVAQPPNRKPQFTPAVEQLRSTAVSPLPRISMHKNNANAVDLIITHQAGGFGANPSQMSSPHGFCLGFNDEILIVDTNNHRIQFFSKKGEYLMHFGNNGSEDGNLNYPKKIVPFSSNAMDGYVVVDRCDNRARLQVFSRRGEFVRRLVTPFLEYVSAMTALGCGQLLLISSISMVFLIEIDRTEPRVLRWIDCGKVIGEPSDVTVCNNLFFVTDYKFHCVVALTFDGETVFRFGTYESTPYPIGIDVTPNNELLVADSHGNHLHVACFTNAGQKMGEFECTQTKVSRCVGLCVTSNGSLVTVSKHNHTLLILNAAHINPALV